MLKKIIEVKDWTIICTNVVSCTLQLFFSFTEVNHRDEESSPLAGWGVCHCWCAFFFYIQNSNSAQRNCQTVPNSGRQSSWCWIAEQQQLALSPSLQSNRATGYQHPLRGAVTLCGSELMVSGSATARQHGVSFVDMRTPATATPFKTWTGNPDRHRFSTSIWERWWCSRVASTQETASVNSQPAS